MYEINEFKEHKITINKSDFIALVYPIKSKDDILISLKDAKTKYPKATHYCYAATLGDKREWAAYQDNGEPKGTAGPPILDVLDHYQLTNILCIVIRYYGGIKLGAGGLIRAYSNATSKLLEQLLLFEKKEVYTYDLIFPYQFIHQVESLLYDQATIIEKTFLENVCFHISILTDDLSFLDEIKHVIKIIKKDNNYIYQPIK